MRLSVRAAARSTAPAVIEKERTETAVARVDHDAFRLIFDRYARPVTSFIYDMVGQRELAEELAQETFVRAYKGMAGLRDESKLSTWLFGIAKNVAYEALRSRRRRNYVAIDEVTEVQVRDESPLPEGQLLNKELSAVIESALAGLDDDKRTVFTLKIYQQKSYEEIAGITGFSIAKLKTDLHRARAEMRRRLGPYLEGVQ